MVKYFLVRIHFTEGGVNPYLVVKYMPLYASPYSLLQFAPTQALQVYFPAYVLHIPLQLKCACTDKETPETAFI